MARVSSVAAESSLLSEVASLSERVVLCKSEPSMSVISRLASFESGVSSISSSSLSVISRLVGIFRVVS